MPDDVHAAVRSLRLLTVNTHKGFGFFNRKFVLHDLREAVRGESADLVFMQEVQGSHTGHSSRYPGWPSVPHYEFLADSIWSEYAYGQNAVYKEGHHGNALLSKFPILRHDNVDVSIWGREQRGLLHSVIQLPGHSVELHAICVHLGLLEAHRQQQLEMLCGLIREKVPPDAPLCVAGDFNDWRSRAHAVLERGCGLKEAFRELQGKAPQTFPAWFPLLRLDRVYYRNIRPVSARRLSAWPWSRLSDHLALSVEIEL